MRLSIGKNLEKDVRPVQSIFRLIGNDEDALTYALGFLLAHDPDFCVKVIRLCGVRRVRRAFRDTYSVHLQEVTDRRFGRRDIVIESSDLRVVLEAKIHRSEPTTGQLLKYATEKGLWGKFDTRVVVALTQVGLNSSTWEETNSDLAEKGIDFSSVQWHQIIRLALEHTPSEDSDVSRYLFDEFIRYARRDYNMGYYDAEVLIQDVNSESAEMFHENWLYIGVPRDKRAPLYFAPYFTPRIGITQISRVVDTKLLRSSDVIGMFETGSDDQHKRWNAGYSKFAKWSPDKEYQLFFLDCPITFRTDPLTKGDFPRIPSQIPKGFSLRFDELLGAP